MNIRTSFLIALLVAILLGSVVLSQNAGTGNISPLNGGLPSPLLKVVTGTANTGGVTVQSLIAAQGSGIYIYVTQAICVNSSASTVSVANIVDGSTTRATIACPAAGSGREVLFNPPIKMANNAAAGMGATTSSTTMYFTLLGYTASR